MGYYGGTLTVGDKYYKAKVAEEVSRNIGNTSEEEMISLLSQYSSNELATLLVELVRDSQE
jgi:hypothetical protein